MWYNIISPFCKIAMENAMKKIFSTLAWLVFLFASIDDEAYASLQQTTYQQLERDFNYILEECMVDCEMRKREEILVFHAKSGEDLYVLITAYLEAEKEKNIQRSVYIPKHLFCDDIWRELEEIVEGQEKIQMATIVKEEVVEKGYIEEDDVLEYIFWLL